jgi:16S rRNA (guanine966-N2)-methyltransferase
MRVIAGQWRGRPLVAPKGSATRPTADRTRETLFSMLASRLGSFEGLRVADLFAGSGALGIEALSRGAAHCTFVETDRAALEAIASNLGKLGAAHLATIKSCSVETFTSAEPYDLVLADPPYAYGARNVIDTVANAGIVAANGWLAVETARGESVTTDAFAVEAERDVGRARLLLLRRD